MSISKKMQREIEQSAFLSGRLGNAPMRLKVRYIKVLSACVAAERARAQIAREIALATSP